MSCEDPIKNEYARGIDVSRWQGDIDWPRVAGAGITHAIAKMTEGETTQIQNLSRTSKACRRMV